MATVPKGKAIALVRKRIVPVSQADPYLKVLLYGRNGMGKTRFACTAPKPLLIDIQEKGTKSVRNYKDVEVFPAKSWKEVVWAYWFLRAGGHDYESVILDTLTGMQNVCMVQVLKESEDRDPTKDPKTASQRDWGKLAQLMKEQLLNFRNLDMHVIFTAQERTYDTTKKRSGWSVCQIFRLGPELPPQLVSISSAASTRRNDERQSRGVRKGSSGKQGSSSDRTMTSLPRTKQASSSELK
jgi:hypothetical protein